MAVDRGFPKSVRLLRRLEFKEVFDRGVVRKDARLVAYLLPTGGPAMRLGIVVGRAARGSVPRNRLKRLIREGFRTTRASLPRGVDVILLPRHGAKLTLAGVQESVTRLLSRAVTEKLREPGPEKTDGERRKKNGPRKRRSPPDASGPQRAANSPAGKAGSSPPKPATARPCPEDRPTP